MDMTLIKGELENKLSILTGEVDRLNVIIKMKVIFIYFISLIFI